MSFATLEGKRRCNARHLAKLKQEMRRELGMECACCGSTFQLTLDHLLPYDGNRRRAGSVAALVDARRSGWDRAQYQVLCASCNLNKSTGNCDHAAMRILYCGEGQ